MPGASLLKSLAWTQGIKFTAKPPSCFPFFFWTLAAWVGQGLLFSLGRVGGRVFTTGIYITLNDSMELQKRADLMPHKWKIKFILLINATYRQ